MSEYGVGVAVVIVFSQTRQTQPDFWKSESETETERAWCIYIAHWSYFGAVCFGRVFLPFNQQWTRLLAYTRLNKLSNFSLNCNTVDLSWHTITRDFLDQTIPFVEFKMSKENQHSIHFSQPNSKQAGNNNKVDNVCGFLFLQHNVWNLSSAERLSVCVSFAVVQIA